MDTYVSTYIYPPSIALCIVTVLANDVACSKIVSASIGSRVAVWWFFYQNSIASWVGAQIYFMQIWMEFQFHLAVIGTDLDEQSVRLLSEQCSMTLQIAMCSQVWLCTTYPNGFADLSANLQRQHLSLMLSLA